MAKKKTKTKPRGKRDVPKARARRERNAVDGQRAERPPQAGTRMPGEDERIAERRVKAFGLRKAGASYRAIARELTEQGMPCDPSTVWSDVQTELAAIRTVTRETADDVKAIEIQRLDDWTLGLTNKARTGDEKAVRALVQVSTRRARLLGLDAPIDVRINPANLTDDELDTLQRLLLKATGGTK